MRYGRVNQKRAREARHQILLECPQYRHRLIRV
jgi:hypothetical protein